MEPAPKIGLIADDFTGALDAGAQFFPYQRNGEKDLWTVNFRLTGAGSGDVEIINTGSREISGSLAAEKASLAAKALGGRLLFKKIDSTMRGNISAEIEAIMAVTGQAKALLCPVIPDQGRTVVDGILRVNGVPLDETSFKNDPVWPARSSSVTQLLGRQCGHIALDVVRQGVEAVSGALRNQPDRIVTADAETQADLDILARAAYQDHALPCGAFGLARAFVDQLPFIERGYSGFSGIDRRPSLVMVGSANQVSRDQVAELLNHSGVFRVELSSQPGAAELSRIKDAVSKNSIIVLAAVAKETIRTEEWMRFGDKLAAFGLDVIRAVKFRSIFVIGGETLSTFTSHARAESIQLTGELLPGIPSGVIHGGELDGQVIMTKAGGFGDTLTLAKILIGR